MNRINFTSKHRMITPHSDLLARIDALASGLVTLSEVVLSMREQLTDLQLRSTKPQPQKAD